MTYEQLRRILGRPDELDRTSVKGAVVVLWRPRPNPEPYLNALRSAQVQAAFKGQNVQRRRPFMMMVERPFAGTLHGVSMDDDPATFDFAELPMRGMSPMSIYFGGKREFIYDFTRQDGQVISLTAWLQGYDIEFK